MNNASDFLRVVRGPILLITLGVLFVLDQQSAGLPFYRTWPILLILFGIFRLAERVLAPPAPIPPVPPTAPPPPASGYGTGGGYQAGGGYRA